MRLDQNENIVSESDLRFISASPVSQTLSIRIHAVNTRN